MAFQKKELKEVKEQPGSKQKMAPKDKPEMKESKKHEKSESKGFEKKESRFESKPGTEGRAKNEKAEYHETGLQHP